MSHQELLSLLREAEGRFVDSAYRIVPASFSLNDTELTGFPVDAQWRWPSCARTLRSWDAHGVMMRAPLLWQLEVPLRHACDEAEAFVFINDAGNMPLGAAAIRQARIDAVITGLEDADAFASHLREHSVPLPAFLLVASLDEAARPLPHSLSNARVSRELHLFPGVPVFAQCATLSASAEPRFHSTDGHSVEVREGRALCTSQGHGIALRDYELPFALVSEGACACGSETWRVL